MRKSLMIPILTLTGCLRPAAGAEYFVTPAGNDGAGTAEDPWSLEYALRSPPALRPGDVIWVRGGRYRAPEGCLRAKLAGTESEPVVIRNYRGERATVDGCFDYGGAEHVWFWGLEFTSSDPPPPPELTQEEQDRLYRSGEYRADGLRAGPHAVRLINCVVHGMKQGNSLGGENSEYYGNIFYGNGRPQKGGPGQHAMYMQNEHGAVRVIDNLVGGNHHMGIHVYAEGGHINGFRLEGNVVFSQQRHINILAGGFRHAERLAVIDNVTYYPANRGTNTNIRIGWNGVCLDPVIEGNLSVFGSVALDGCLGLRFRNNVVIGAPSELQVRWPRNPQAAADYLFGGNSYWNLNFNPFHHGGGAYRGENMNFARWREAFGLDEDSQYFPGRPRQTQVIVRPNRYEPGRANVVVLNWGNEKKVRVDVGEVLKPGDRYELRSVADFYGDPLASGVYEGGGAIEAPAEQIAGKLPDTGPEFGLFVLVRSSQEEE